jgi:hypothetical protein
MISEENIQLGLGTKVMQNFGTYTIVICNFGFWMTHTFKPFHKNFSTSDPY